MAVAKPAFLRCVCVKAAAPATNASSSGAVTDCGMCHAARLPRRAFVRVAAFTVAAFASAPHSRAFSLAENGVRASVAQVSLSLQKAISLLPTVKSFKQSIAGDDADFVRRYAAIWLEPGRVAMKQLSEQSAVQLSDSHRINMIAGATLGHMLELSTELQTGTRDRVARELEEYIESATDLLSLPSVQPYVN